jgi:hypothetical protein
MTRNRFIFILSALLLSGNLPSQALRPYFPTPAEAPNQLFYLQRSKDANTVIYEANLTTDQKLHPEKPVDVYWIRYAEKGQREDLSRIQWKKAFGYTYKPSADSEAYDISLNAFRDKPIHITHYRGKPVAMLPINGQQAFLQKIFVQVDPKAQLIPLIRYVDLYGSAVDTSQPVYERLIP